MTRTAPGFRAARQAPARAANNIYTVMLVIAFAFLVTAIVFNELDLIGTYEVEWWRTLWPF